MKARGWAVARETNSLHAKVRSRAPTTPAVLQSCLVDRYDMKEVRTYAGLLRSLTACERPRRSAWLSHSAAGGPLGRSLDPTRSGR
jgi:hypothetical protein